MSASNMKATFATALALLTTACAHTHTESHAGVIVEPLSSACLDTSRNDAIPLVINNRSSSHISFSAAEASGPSYLLHPATIRIERVGAAPHDDSHWHVILEHYFAPKHQVQLGPGDRAEVLAYANHWPSPGYPGRVQVTVIDTHGFRHQSHAVQVCELSAALATPGR
jgi:hypothetical protein